MTQGGGRVCGSDGGTVRSMAQRVGREGPARETGHGAVGEEGNGDGRIVFLFGAFERFCAQGRFFQRKHAPENGGEWWGIIKGTRQSLSRFQTVR